MLTSDSQGWGFTKGWKEFAHDHSLVLGHILVFTYDGPSQFSVTIFHESGMKDKSTLSIQPRDELVFRAEEEGGVANVDVAGM